MKLEKFNEFYEPKQYQDYELENGICVMQCNWLKIDESCFQLFKTKL